MTDHNDREGAGSALRPTLRKRVHNVDVVGIRESIASLADGDPLEGCDFGVGPEARGFESVRIHLRGPVVHDLVATARDLVPDLAERCTEPDGEPGLLRNLPHGGLR